jgi:hypothetical protein
VQPHKKSAAMTAAKTFLIIEVVAKPKVGNNYACPAAPGNNEARIGAIETVGKQPKPSKKHGNAGQSRWVVLPQGRAL